MKSSTTAEFWRLFDALPAAVQESARKAYRLWSRDPTHRSLRFKKVGTIWSVRISRGYRALALLQGDAAHWFWIGPHDEYERMIRR
jgi:hypothetical protein